MAQVVAKLQTNATSCTATFSQLAAVQAAAQADQSSVDAMVAEFRRRRDAIVDGCARSPASPAPVPRARSTVFPNITRTGYSSTAAGRQAARPGRAWPAFSGTAFGEFGEGHLRLLVREQHGEHPRPCGESSRS